MANEKAVFKILGAAPVIAVALAVLLLAVNPIDKGYESPLLLRVANTIFLALLPFVVSAQAARAFVRFGSFHTLMLGGGTLALGWGSLIAGWVMGLPGSPNHAVTVHNIGALLGGFCHFSSSIRLVRLKMEKKDRKSSRRVVVLYASIMALLTLIAAMSLAGLTPLFFTSGPGGGPTPLRQWVLLGAVCLYAISALLFFLTCRKSGESFFYWYGLTLVLIAIGLFAVFMERSVGDLLGWSGRIAQYLAGLYFIIVMQEVTRSARQKGLSVDKTLTFFFKNMEHSYRVLLESVNDAVFCFDRQFHVFLCNSQAEAMIGRPRQEIIGTFFPDLLQSGKEELLEAVRPEDGMKVAQSCCREALLGKSDGTALSVEYSLAAQGAGSEFAVIAVVRDITRRRRMEEMLRRSNDELERRVAERTSELAEMNTKLQEEIEDRRRIEQELRLRKERIKTLFAHMAQGAFYQNRSGRLTEVNESALEIFGLTRTEFLSRTSFSPHWKVINEDGSVVPPEEHPSMVALRTGKPVRDRIAGVFNPETGECHWLVINALPQFEEGESEPFEVFVTLHDVTLLKEMEFELRQSRENLEKRVEERTLELQKTHGQLLHAEKLSAIGSLSASVAHEFNNPLQSVMTVLKGFRCLNSLKGEEKMLLDSAIQECERMRNLIKSLQDFNRPTSGRCAPMDLHAALNGILLLSKHQYKQRGITVKKEFIADALQIEAVADQIKQVLLNLLNNAADACEEGGTITVGTSLDGRGNVIITIADNGKGISQEILSRIFEPFFTTKSAVKGTGLGLSVSHGIMKRHGGQIQVSSEPGKGSTFTVILPIHPVRKDSDEMP